ncbi:YbjN domain-containing protein [Candidatus Marithioploca araucensis]|uniref:YbjN domain-containing protein n=1 Tax=Candidatus Marithioploca araucensis TaxID=70273 RepID=A0ABT7VSN1_9GAMM|nr:YbjN domain-containing protein [Candidatus Marithioploca araucensis]
MNNSLISEDNVTPKSIGELFENALIKATVDEEGDIQITTDMGTVFFVTLLQNKKMLKYLSFFSFKDKVLPEKNLSFLNTLNAGVIFSRFSMPKENVLLSEYFLSYEEGIPSYQVVKSFRLFERVTMGLLSNLIPLI